MDLTPFEIRDGALHLEQVPLPALAEDLAGLPGAWVVSRAAVEAVLSADDGPWAVSPRRLSPPALLALAAAAGHWACVRSSHELGAATAAGFPPEHIVVRGAVKEDGLLRDALAAGVAVLEADAGERAVLERIAAALDHPLPPVRGAPPDLDAGAFSRCGGLLARVLRDAPEVALDAPAPVVAGAHAVPAAPVAPSAPRRVLPLLLALSLPAGPSAEAAAPLPGTLTGLSTGDDPEPFPVSLLGPLRRGAWALLPDPRATAWKPDDGVHPGLPSLLVQGASWRPLDRRPGPPSLEP